MMTAKSMLSKRPVLRLTVVLLFLVKLFSFHIRCIPIYFYKISNMMITDTACAKAFLGGGGHCAMPSFFDSAF